MENEKITDNKTLVLTETTLPVIEQMAEFMPGGFFIYRANKEEEIIYVNKTVIKMFGCKNLEEFKKLTGNSFKGFVHPDDYAEVSSTIEKQLEQNGYKHDYEEYRIVRKDGSVRWVVDYGQVVSTDSLGDLFYVFINDETEKHIKKQEEKRKTEVIAGLSSNYDSIYLLDFLSGKLIPYRLDSGVAKEMRVGAAGMDDYKKIFKAYAEKHVLPTDRDLYIQETAVDRIRDRLKYEKNYTVDFRRYDENGVMEYVQMAIARIEDENRYTRAVMGYRTVTEQVLKVQEETAKQIRMERELDEARHASQAKSAFLFNMSHDIRTPMNAIMGFTALAKKYINQPEQLSDCLNKIDMSSNHLFALINDVLDMSQIESGRLNIKTEYCNLTEQIDIVLEMLENRALEKNISLTSEINIMDKEIYSDSLNLRRILANVIGNAVKFTNSKGKVEFTVNQKPVNEDGFSEYEFVVKDTGIGMSEEFMTKLFDAFEKEETSTKSSYLGIGLGLSITKSLVDLMGGTISAESEKNKGSVFVIKIPFKPAKKEEHNNEVEDLINRRIQSDKFKDKRILLVEDNELNREIAVEFLTDSGFILDAVADGCYAVEAIKNNPAGYYDLVLMDIQMPVMNGYDATRAIRSIEREDIKNLPIIALSANSMDEDRKKSMESGMNAHIAKPIDVINLIGTLGKYIPERSN